MAGMINKQMAATEQAAPPVEPTAVPGEVPEEQGESNEAYDRVVLAGMKALYDKKTNGAIMEMLKAGAADPARTIAETTFTLMSGLDEQSGGTIPEDVLIPAAAEMLELVAELAEKSKIFPVDEKTLPLAMQDLVAIGIERGVIDPAEIQGLIDETDPAEVQRIVQEQEALRSGTGQPQPAAGAV